MSKSTTFGCFFITVGLGAVWYFFGWEATVASMIGAVIFGAILGAEEIL